MVLFSIGGLSVVITCVLMTRACNGWCWVVHCGELFKEIGVSLALLAVC